MQSGLMFWAGFQILLFSIMGSMVGNRDKNVLCKENIFWIYNLILKHNTVIILQNI